MRKFIALLTLCFMVAATPSFASVGVQVENSKLGSATNFRFNTSEQVQVNRAMTFDGSTLTFNLVNAGTGTSGATSLGTGSTNVERGFSLVYKAIGSSVETGFMNNGLPGEVITIIATEAGGGTYTLDFQGAGGASSSLDHVIFGSIDDSITVLYLSTSVGWIQIGDASATVSRLDPS